jgi:hypothetical protein
MDPLAPHPLARLRNSFSLKPVTLCTLVVLGSALVARVGALHRPLWGDEHTTLLLLKLPSLSAALETLREDTHHPAYFALFYIWAKLFPSLGGLRSLSLIFDLLAIACLFRWLRTYAWGAACLGVSLYASLPLLARFAVELRPYALLNLAVVLALGCGDAIRRMQRPGWRQTAALSTCWLGLVGVHPSGLLVVGACAAAGFVSSCREEKSTGVRQRGCLFIAGVLTGAYFLWLHLHWSKHVGNAGMEWMPSLSWGLVVNTTKYLVTEGAYPAVGWLMALLIGGSLLLQPTTNAWTLGVAGLYIAEVLVLSVAYQQIFWYRTLLPALIALVAFVGIKLHGLLQRRSSGPWLAGMALAGVLQSLAWGKAARFGVEPVAAAVTGVQTTGRVSGAYCFPAYIGPSIHYHATQPACASCLPLILFDGAELAHPASLAVFVRADLEMARDLSPLSRAVDRLARQLRPGDQVRFIVYDSHDFVVVGDKVTHARAAGLVGNGFTSCTRSLQGQVEEIVCTR